MRHLFGLYRSRLKQPPTHREWPSMIEAPSKRWCIKRKSVCIRSLKLRDASLRSKMHPTNLIGGPVARLKHPPPLWKQLIFKLKPLLFLLVLHLSSSYILLQANSQAVNESPLTDYDGASFYKASVGSRIRMACNGSHWATDETVSLVLWFKGPVEGHSVPIYTVDARQHSLGSGAARHLIGDQYKGRARFMATSGTPPYLDLGPLEADDQGEYRCRIDYRTKPRENFLVILFVIVPPRSVDITDSAGRSLEQIYGPLSEDSELTLLCLSKGGRPPPALRWRRANKLIDDSYLTLNDFIALKRATKLLEASKASPINNGSFPEPEEASLSGSFTGNWLDWRQWPEFSYYSATTNHHASFTKRTDRAEQPSGSGHQEQEVAGSSQAGQLLTWPPEESLTSSVNVLRLGHLNVRNLVVPYEEAAKLECEASNLFYDLHSLIKLFAPSSLSGNMAHKQQQHQWDASGLQLEAAIDQALDRALTSSPSRLLGHPQLELQQQDATASVHLSIPAPRQHSMPRTSLTNDNEASSPQTPDNPPPPTNDKPAATRATQTAAAVFQQLLERPHQLSAAAINFTINPSSPSTTKPYSRQDQLNLVRTRLITLDIYMRPISVSISQLPVQGGNQRSGSSLSAGQLAEFSCTSSGSRPPAKLSWFKGREPLNVRANIQRLFSGNNSILGTNSSESKLTIRLERADNGQQITCRADNEPLQQFLQQNQLSGHQSASLEETRTLSVQFPPQLKLELGNRALSTQVREGADIFFVCHVDANPQVRDITWLHEQQPVNTTIGKLSGQLGTVIVSNNSLVLQKVRLSQRGRYTCASSNSEGYSESNHLDLRVLHTPICVSDNPRQKQILEEYSEEPVLLGSRQVAIRAHTQLECRVEADPSEVEISWYLGGGQHGSARQISGAQVGPQTKTTTTTTESSSKLNYQVQSPLDYGQLYCLAKNQLGEQRRACAWNIEPPDPARAPPSCALLNVTDTSVTAACSISDGSQSGEHTENNRQLNVELYRGRSPHEPHEASLDANLSTLVHLEEPYFEVNSLKPNTRYTMLIRSVYGQPPAELSFATLTPTSTSGFQLDSRDKPLSDQTASLSALISTRSATLADSADWTGNEQRGFTSESGGPPVEHQSRLQSIWSWLSGSALRAFGLEQRPASSGSGKAADTWQAGGGDTWQASNRMRPAFSSAPINKSWEPSWWSPSSLPLEWRQLITSVSLLASLLLLTLLAILFFLLNHKYSSNRVSSIWWRRWGKCRSGRTSTSSSDHNYHQHRDSDKKHELLPLASILNKPTNTALSLTPPSPSDSVQTLDVGQVRSQLISPSHTPHNKTRAPSYKSSTLDRSIKQASGITKSRSSFSFEAPVMGNRHNDSTSQIFLSTTSNKQQQQHWNQQQLLVEEGNCGELKQLEPAPLNEHQGSHQPSEYDVLTMQLCQQMLHSSSRPAEPMSLIKSNEPLILTGSGNSQHQAPDVRVLDNEEDCNSHGCCQVSCLMHDQPPPSDAVQFLSLTSNASSYLNEQRHWPITTTNNTGLAQAQFAAQCEAEANFLDQQMHFIELLPRQSNQNTSLPNYQQQCMDINLNFVNIVDDTQSMQTIGRQPTASQPGEPMGAAKLSDLVPQCMLTKCHHPHPPSMHLDPRNGSLECPSLTSSVSPSSSTFKDQSPLSLTTTGHSTVTTSTNYSTSELFPFSASSATNCIALLEQHHSQGRPASSSLRHQVGGKLIHSHNRAEVEHLEEGDHSGLLVCSHNHQTTGTNQPPIASILKTGKLSKRNSKS